MGPTPSKLVRPRNDAIHNVKPTREMIKAFERRNKLIKFLLLGAGESGKSTVLKQMTLLHGGGFSNEYRSFMKPLISFNVIEGAFAVINAMAEIFLTSFDEKEAIKAAEFISVVYETNKMNYSRFEIVPEVAEAVNLVTKDKNFMAALSQSSQFQIQDGWIEFAKNLRDYPHWGGPEWVPSKEDILLSRVRTTGINEEYFIMKDSIYEMIDVGGQEAERKKWSRLFRGIHGVLYVTSLSEYDQFMFETPDENRLYDSIRLWRNTSHLEDFRTSALLLFLNKFDLFQQKYFYKSKKIPDIGRALGIDGLPAPPLKEDEKGENCELAIAWFKKLFLSVAPIYRRETTFVHVTTAVDSKNMTTVINETSTYILRFILGRTGLPVDDLLMIDNTSI